MGKIIGIVSGKGGVGKSTVTACLALILGKGGNKVCVIDGDNGMRSLDILLNVENQVVYDLSDVAEGICPIKRALVKTENENIFLLSANASSDCIRNGDMMRILADLRTKFDYILIDGPAGSGAGFTNVITGADSVYIVTTADPIAVRDAERVAGLVKKQGVPDIRLILNRQTRTSESPKFPLSPEEISHRTDLKLIGRIPEDRKILINDHPSMKGSAWKALSRIATRVGGNEIPIPTKVTGIFG